MSTAAPPNIGRPPNATTNRRLTGAQRVVKRQMDRLAASAWVQIVADYEAAQRTIEAELIKLYRKHATEGKLTYAEMTRYNRLSTLNRNIAEDLKPYNTNANRITVTLAESEYHESYFRHGYTTHSAIALDVTYGEIDHAVIAQVVDSDGIRGSLKTLTDDGLTSLRRQIRTGIILGEDYPTITRRVEKTFDTQLSKHERIVRTEGQRAYVLGKQDGYEHAADLGLVFDELWVATLDLRTRPSHGQLDGTASQEVEPGEAGSHLKENGTPRPVTKAWFHPEVGYWFRGPLQSGVASFDINCRCTTLTQYEGLEITRGARGVTGSTKQLTYEQWRRKYKIRDTSKLIIPGGL